MGLVYKSWKTSIFTDGDTTSAAIISVLLHNPAQPFSIYASECEGESSREIGEIKS